VYQRESANREVVEAHGDDVVVPAEFTNGVRGYPKLE
jgi:hypothetical protein